MGEILKKKVNQSLSAAGRGARGSAMLRRMRGLCTRTFGCPFHRGTLGVKPQVFAVEMLETSASVPGPSHTHGWAGQAPAGLQGTRELTRWPPVSGLGDGLCPRPPTQHGPW